MAEEFWEKWGGGGKKKVCEEAHAFLRCEDKRESVGNRWCGFGDRGWVKALEDSSGVLSDSRQVKAYPDVQRF